MYRVLIADDKEIFCRVITRMDFFQTDESGFKIVYAAHNGIEALDYLRKEHIDVTLTDIRMPLLNGLELLKTIQAEKLCPCTVLLSEYSEFSYAKEGLINGAFDYLIKPIKSEDIKATFARIRTKLEQLQQEQFSPEQWDGILSNSLIDGESEELSSIIHRLLYALPDGQELSPDGLSGVLANVAADIRAELPYIQMYIPLEKLCVFPLSVVDASDARCFFEQTLYFLQNELKKFRLNSKHSQIREIWNYTLSNIEGTCQLQEAAEKFYMNKNYLSTLFRKETGMNYKSFVLQFKIERAKQLISYSGMKLPSIADALYFNDTEYFSRVFKGRVGVSPGKYSYDAFIESELNIEKSPST